VQLSEKTLGVKQVFDDLAGMDDIHGAVFQIKRLFQVVLEDGNPLRSRFGRHLRVQLDTSHLMASFPQEPGNVAGGATDVENAFWRVSGMGKEKPATPRERQESQLRRRR
jgi:hypothetical protein